MPSYNSVLSHVVAATGNATFDNAKDYRNELIEKIKEHTGRNVIVYYSGWLQKTNLPSSALSITDLDMNGFMACVQKKADRKKELDLILHTPGGDIAATESIIDYLYHLYEVDILPSLKRGDSYRSLGRSSAGSSC